MLYVSKIFSSIQGEGAQTGLPSLFVRLAGCNKQCSFCDTDFTEKGVFEPKELAQIISQRCKDEGLHNVAFTGGEPLLQLVEIKETIREASLSGYYDWCSLETNGTIDIMRDELPFFNHISMSPKQSFNETKLKRCHSLKILYPFQFPEEDFIEFYTNTVHCEIYLIPIDTRTETSNTSYQTIVELTINKVKELHKQGFDRVKLGVQLHKYLGLE